MRGLLRDNFYTAYANAKVFFAVLFLVGIVAATVYPGNGEAVFFRNYMLLCLIGVSYVSLDSLGKDKICKWERYKLTAPVTRADIVRSCYIGQLVWIAAGALFSSVPAGFSMMLHGFRFDLSTDLPLIYMMGISISLFMGAVFFPLFYLCGEERKEAFLLVSILSGVAVTAGLVAFFNFLFGYKMTSFEIMLSASAILACAVLVFGLSLLLAIRIFSKKEY